MKLDLSPTGVLVKSPKQVALPDFGVVVQESRHAPGFAGELSDPYAKFHLVIAGQACWESAGEKFLVGPNTLFHIAARVPHRQQDYPNAPVTLLFVHYRPELLPGWLNEELSRRRMLPLDLASAQIDRSRPVRALFQEMLFEQSSQQPGWQTLLQARLLELAVMTARLSQRQPHAATTVFERGDDTASRVANYVVRLQSEFYRATSLEEAAHSVCLSRRHFTEVFRKLTGQTWHRYVHQLRLQHAAKLLAETAQSVTAIAFECGFEDLSHFHHSFRKAFHCAPLSYRNQHLPTQPSSPLTVPKPQRAGATAER